MTSSPVFPLVSVVGTVSMWGRVIEHDRGWRAGSAYPARLTLVCGQCLREGAGRGKASLVVRKAGENIGASAVFAMCTDHVSQVAPAGPRALAHGDEMHAALLDRYAVDRMPFETVRCLFEREPVPGPVPFRRPPPIRPQPVVAQPSSVPATTPPSRRVPATPAVTTPAVTGAAGSSGAVTAGDPLPWRIARGLSQAASFLAGVAVVVVMSVASLHSCIVTVEARDRPVGSSTATEPILDPSRPVVERAGLARARRPMPLPRLEIVCGLPHGAWVELVGCSRGPLLGFASSPPQSCIDEVVAVTRRPWFSICWISVGPIDVDPHPAAENPFRGGER
jgi:hypothetical protein